MTPRRIQRRRTKGYRLPEGAVYVGRPTRWGNPYRAGEELRSGPAEVVAWYRYWLLSQPAMVRRVRQELAGKDLACWCPTGQPCHADVLLAVANAPEAADLTVVVSPLLCDAPAGAAGGGTGDQPTLIESETR